MPGNFPEFPSHLRGLFPHSLEIQCGHSLDDGEHTVSSPFDLAKHPCVIKIRPNYRAFLHTFWREYGIRDPHRFYVALRREIQDRARPDPFGITMHKTLDDWWMAKVIEWRYLELFQKWN